LETSIFASYAHIDDAATHGRVRQVVEDVGKSYESLTGSAASIFMDVTSLRPGEIWRATVDSNLAKAPVLLAFVSPAALRSREWRREVRRFLDSPGKRLVIPLIYGDRIRIRENFQRDLLWRRIEKVQYLTIHQLRTAAPGSDVWMEHIERIAGRIDQVRRELTA
jgi:TIR domain